MRSFWKQQRRWSYRIFGLPKNRGPLGPLLHLKKEAQEAVDEAAELERVYQDIDRADGPLLFERLAEEIVDCQFLVFDAAHRLGISYDELVERCFVKLDKNRKRKWVNKGSNLPVEHDRGGE